jgi:DNA-binding SARP family transcriptional activator/tetratricopeptide (TPR) repeat protein
MGLPFQLRCLGRPQLISPGGEPVRLKVRKHLALLAYLALEPRVPHRREKLADLLWGNASPGEGRHSLATAASMIRGKLGRDALEGDRDHLRFTARNLAVDLERLAAGDLFGDQYRPALEVGGFLVDFEVPDAVEFMQWSERQRARWLPLVRDALVRLIDRCRRTGDFKQIEGLGNSLLDIDELSEDGIRAKMEARAFDGDRLTSLKIFEAWKLKLAAELQAVPSPLVEGIAIRLRRRDWESTSSNIPTVPTDQWKGRPFVGRGTEYRALYESWEKTLQRFPHHALVLGDSGVGKSTLLERVATAAGLEGGAISRISCYELEREIPYAAIGGLVAGLLDRPGVSGTPPEWLAELSRTVPEVRRRFPSIPDPIETQGETARIRLTEAVQQLTQSIAEEHPVILVIDDVHLADDASLAVLHLLMRRAHDQRIMVLLAARSAELGQSPHALWLRDGHESLRMQILDLQPMTAEECEELLSSLVETDTLQPSAAARRALLRAAAGFPMVLEYLVKDWRINGDQCLALSIGAMTEEPRTASAPSQTYHLIVQRIVHSLEPSVRNVLNMASVLGARLNDVEMYRLADVSIGQTMTALGRLTDMRILRDGGRGLEFCNELVRGEAYLGVPSPVRKTLHRSIAERLISQEGEGTGIPGLEIAWHCIRGGKLETATPYLLRGAREAIRRGAPHEAERALETALDHLDEPARTDALLLLAEALHEQGRWEDVLATLTDAGSLFNASQKEWAFILSVEPRRRLGMLEIDESNPILAELLLIGGHGTSISTKVRAVTNAAYLLVYHRSKDVNDRVTELVEELRSLTLSDDDFAQVTLASAINHYHYRRIDLAISELSEAAARLIAVGLNNHVSAAVQIALANMYSANALYDLSSCHNHNAFNLANAIGNDWTSSRAAANMTMCRCRLGQYKETLVWSRLAASKDPQYKSDSICYSLFHSTIASAMLGDTDEANKTLSRLDLLAQTSQNPMAKQNAYLFLADGYMMAGNRPEAYRRAKEATTGQFGKLWGFNSVGLYARWMAALAIQARNTSEARHIIGELLQKRKTFDRIDQTEVLCAKIMLDGFAGGVDSRSVQILQEELHGLPRAVRSHLARLGFLPF